MPNLWNRNNLTKFYGEVVCEMYREIKNGNDTPQIEKQLPYDHNDDIKSVHDGGDTYALFIEHDLKDRMYKLAKKGQRLMAFAFFDHRMPDTLQIIAGLNSNKPMVEVKEDVK